MGTAVNAAIRLPVEQGNESMARHKAADEGIDPRIRNIVYIAREIGLPTIVVFSLLVGVAWLGPNVVTPMVKTFEAGPAILTQQVEMNKMVLGMYQTQADRDARQQLFLQSVNENLQTILKRMDK